MTELSIPTSAGAFDATVAGPPDGRPVLLLHGFPQTRTAWRHQMTTLAAHGYRVVAPDQRGYSPGSAPSDPRTIASTSWSTTSSRSRSDWAGRRSTWWATTGEARWPGGPPTPTPPAYAR